MGNYRIVFGDVLGAGQQAYVTGITDLGILNGAGEPLLVSITRAGGGMAVFNAATGTVLQTAAISTDLMQLTPPALSLMQDNGQTYLATLGLRDPGLPAITVLPDGALGASAHLTAQGQDLGLITGMTAAQFGDAQYHFASMRTPGLLRLDAQGATQFTADPITLSGHGTRHSVTDIATVTVGGRDHIVTSHATANSVSVYRLTESGDLQHRSDYGAAQGLGINAPTAIQPVQIGDQAFIIVASTLSSSLSVLRVGIDGVLSPVDHVVDDLNTRFFRVNALETVTVNDRHFVLAGGGDDGVSLFLILPTGRLVHLDSMADTLEATLARVSNLAAMQMGDTLHVFATSEREPGVTRLSVDVANTGQTLIASEGGSRVTGSAQDDILIGSNGNDTLIGGEGNDIIFDGPGRDQMTGGPGADLFVLAADGGTDVITDFEPGLDRLDLSAWVGLTSDSQLQIERRPWGAELRFQSEVLELRSANGGSLSRSDVLWAPVLNVTRFPLSSLPSETLSNPGETPAGQPLNLSGTTGNDVLRGRAGNDTLNGAAGDDLLFGGDGDNDLRGGDGDDTLSGGAGNDSLFGGDGNDFLFGGPGDDLLVGGIGANRMDGGEGSDVYEVGPRDVVTDSGEQGYDIARIIDQNGIALSLRGWRGVDQVEGGAGNDTIDATGQPEAIQLYGFGGDDVLIGGNGDDLIYGGDGNDRLIGGIGDDTLFGGPGDDTLIGWHGADVMDGGDGSDLYMVDALDLVIDTGTTGYDRANIYQTTGVALNINAWRGVDRVNGNTGNDTLDASQTTAPIFLFGADGDDLLLGGAGDDWIVGNIGDDTLFGGPGDDTLIGWHGADVMDGGEGSDLYMVDALDLVIDTGTTGYDRANIYQTTGVALDINAWRGVDRVNGNTGNDTLDASQTTDTIFLFGAGGDDLLLGGAGDDTLSGGEGDDTLIGGAGNDWLIGGDGADQFVFRPGFGRDVIADFEPGIDVINLAAFAELQGFADLQISQFRADTVIRTSVDSFDLLILANIDMTRLTSEDFIF